MSEYNTSAEKRELILKYLRGVASDAEVRQLEEWVMEKEENRAFFRGEKRAWVMAGMTESKADVDVDKAWRETEEQLFDKGKVVKMGGEKRVGRRNWMGIAATLALLAAAAIWLFIGQNGSEKVYAAEDKVIEQRLSDGSSISLNQYSSITFDPDYEGQIRKVALSGDAFFDVARDEARPFVIEAGNVEIKVLGTSFYVDSRDGQAEVQVIVKSGSVAVQAGESAVVLSAGESAIFNKSSGQLNKKINDDPNFLAWTSQVLTFEESTLEEVVFALNRQYHSSISLDNPALKNCKLTARYENKTLAAVLRIIEKTLEVEIADVEGKPVIKGEGCD